MQLNIYNHNVNLTPQIEEIAHDRLGKLDRYLPNISEVRLELSRNNAKRGEDITVAQITLRHSRGAILRAEERVAGDERETLIKAINTASDKMFRQIERFKGKALNRRRRGGDKADRFIATEEELEIAEDVPNYEEIGTQDYPIEDVEIVRRKAMDLTPMTDEEAIEQMELLGHKFFMYLDSVSGTVNVLYLRDGGGYGILVPNS
jgi:putative sigma-54 modulation protein